MKKIILEGPGKTPGIDKEKLNFRQKSSSEKLKWTHFGLFGILILLLSILGIFGPSAKYFAFGHGLLRFLEFAGFLDFW